MDDELRKAAGTAVDVWDDTGTRHEDVVNAMNDLRKVLAKNANAAPEQEPVAWTYPTELEEIKKDVNEGFMWWEKQNAANIPLYTRPMPDNVTKVAMQKVMARLAYLLDEDQFADIEGIVQSAGVEPPIAAPDSSLAPQIESLIAEYWDIAYEEGKTGISQGDLANQVLGRIRNALIAWSQRAAPQDQDAKDAADIFWDYEDGEYCVRSIQEICENACDRGAENGAVLRVNQAKSLPHIFLRLIVPENPDDSVDYITISESEAIATMQQEQKP